MRADDNTFGQHIESDELVRRLSELEWASLPGAMRTRCWSEFASHMQTSNGASPESGTRPRAFNIGVRYEMRRFAPSRRLSVAELPRLGRAHVPRRTLSA